MFLSNRFKNIYLLFLLQSLIVLSLSAEENTTSSQGNESDSEEIYTKYVPTNTSYYNKDRKQAPYPEPDELGDCGAWVKIDNVCCARYCDNIDSTEDCEACGGNTGEHCKVPDSFECRSGTWGHDFGEIKNEYHYSRSTHFGITIGGACGFGLYGVCNKDFHVSEQCDAFCKSYPSLCKDPDDITWRGNFAAPPGSYYSQFWGALEGDRDNYLSCGECFEVTKTKPDGSDYKPGDEGYVPPILLSLIDSCPCSANAKWCCHQYDQCQEAKIFKYGCPLQEGSMHLDLSDIAMARLQTGDANGEMVEGIIPTIYRRVPCPKVGNLHMWLRAGGGQYYFAFTIVNAAGNGAVTMVELKNAAGKWIKFLRDPNYSSSRPQERYGSWTTPQESGPYELPIDCRITDGSGQQVFIKSAIKSFEPPEDADPQFYYIDLGVNFPEIPIPPPPEKPKGKIDDNNNKNGDNEGGEIEEEKEEEKDEVYSTYIEKNSTYYNKDRKQGKYPTPDAKGNCGTWATLDNVCCASGVKDSFECRSGDWGYDFSEIKNEYHYSRSTSFGMPIVGACGFGLFGVCNKGQKDMGKDTSAMCDAFCKSYPSLCKDPEEITWRGNFVAPNGNYYSQFWGGLEGDRDNYLSCGECFEIIKTKEDGSIYKPGDEGYTPPIIGSVLDTCPCSTNSKWCCGKYDQCQDAKNFKYGCPLPEDSLHLALSDVAMARLQKGDPDSSLTETVIPTIYRRVPCPKVGNLYLWLKQGGTKYYFSFSIVNAAGNGAIAIAEIRNADGNWVKCQRDPNYHSSRPQERNGVFVTPQNMGTYKIPVDLRLTDGSGQRVFIKGAIQSFDPPEDADPAYYYIDLGVNFPEIEIPKPPEL